MSADEIRTIQEQLAEIDREASETDHAVDELKRALLADEQEVRHLRERAERVQRRLATA